MTNFTRTAVLAGLLLVAVGCSSSKPTATAGSSTTTSAGGAGGASSTTTAASGSGGDTTAFCAKLAAEVDQTAALRAAIGTPDQDAKVADIKAANADIEASAPADVADAVTKFYAISELGVAALSSNSPADKAAAVQAAAAAAKDPSSQAAIADFKTWVQANCGDQAAKILQGQ